METNNYFDLKRLYLLTRRQILSERTGWLIALTAVAGIMLVISLFVAYFNPVLMPALTPSYLSIMFLGGYIFTSSIFNELHYPQKAVHFLTLPVSTTERLLAAWIITGILFPIFSLILIALIVFIANLIMNLTLDLTPFNHAFSNGGAGAFRSYLITQSVFLLGAAYFRKYNFLKTLLAIFVFIVAITIITATFGWIIFSPFSGQEFVEGDQSSTININNLLIERVPALARFVYFYVGVPFFLVVTWFTLKERQV